MLFLIEVDSVSGLWLPYWMAHHKPEMVISLVSNKALYFWYSNCNKCVFWGAKANGPHLWRPLFRNQI